MVALKDLVNQLDVESVYTEERFVKVGWATAAANCCCQVLLNGDQHAFVVVHWLTS